MPSSLTRFLPFALVFSTYLPVSVWGTVVWLHRYAVFLDPGCHALLARRHGVKVINLLPPPSIRGLRFPQVLCFAPPAGTGIFTSCPSPSLLSFGLGPTHPTRTDLPSETLDLRRRWFSHRVRYSCPHSHSPPLQRTLPVRLLRCGDALLPLPSREVPDFGVQL